MTMLQRAAQFAPFAALSGHADAVRETERLTDSEIELDDDKTEMLNKKSIILRDHLNEHPEICITYFLPDEKKEGGYYHTYSGCLRNIDDYEQKFVFTDGMTISISSVFDIDGKLFDSEEI